MNHLSEETEDILFKLNNFPSGQEKYCDVPFPNSLVYAEENVEPNEISVIIFPNFPLNVFQIL